MAAGGTSKPDRGAPNVLKWGGFLLRGLALFLVPLAAWRLWFPLSGWAALALLPLGLAIGFGIYGPLIDRRRAELSAALLPDAGFSRWFTGRLAAGCHAIAAALVAVPILAWIALRVSLPEGAILLLLCLLAGVLAEYFRSWLGRGLTPAYARHYGHWLGSGIAALIALPVLAWLNWAIIPVPHEITGMGLTEAATSAMAKLPPHGGVLREVLALLAALDGAKLWLAAQHREAFWVGAVFSLDAALVSFVVARAFVATCEFGRQL